MNINGDAMTNEAARYGLIRTRPRKLLIFASAIFIIIFVFYFVFWIDNEMFFSHKAMFSFHSSDIIRQNNNNNNEKHMSSTSASGTVPEVINPHNYNYTILPPERCDDVDNIKVFLMVVVLSATHNFEQRHAIRETWGSIVKHDHTVRLVFIMGRTTNKTTAEQIIKESNEYKDIVQEDFLDSYRNLTMKSIATLKWTSVHCKQAKYLLKADDDMFINVPFLLKILREKKLINSCIGFKIVGAKPVQNRNSKWYTPKEMFDGEVYPPYCSGTSYVISGDIVTSLYRVTLSTKPFWLEDIYITGICRTKIKANIVMDFGFTYNKRKVSGCAYRSAVTGHENNPSEIRKIWAEMHDKSLRC